MKVQTRYLKDESGNIISPVTSTDSIFNNSGDKLLNLIQYAGPISLYSSSYTQSNVKSYSLKSDIIEDSKLSAIDFLICFGRLWGGDHWANHYGYFILYIRDGQAELKYSWKVGNVYSDIYHIFKYNYQSHTLSLTEASGYGDGTCYLVLGKILGFLDVNLVVGDL